MKIVPIALSTLIFIKFDRLESLAWIREAGFTNIELDSRFIDPRKASRDDLNSFRKEIEHLHLKIFQVHLPYHGIEGLDIGNLNQNIRSYSIDTIIGAMRNAGDLGAKLTVLHPGSMDGECPPGLYANYRENVIASCKLLAEKAGELNLVLCIENVFPASGKKRFGDSPGDLREIFSAVPAARFCFDTGHPLLMGQSPAGFLTELAVTPATLHLNDNHGDVADEHLIPGEGMLDVNQLLDALVSLDYTGMFLLEIRRASTREECIEKAARAYQSAQMLAKRYSSILNSIPKPLQKRENINEKN